MTTTEGLDHPSQWWGHQFNEGEKMGQPLIPSLRPSSSKKQQQTNQTKQTYTDKPSFQDLPRPSQT